MLPFNFGFPGEQSIVVERVVTQPWLMDIKHLNVFPLIVTVLVTTVSILSVTSSTSVSVSSPGLIAFGGQSSCIWSGQTFLLMGQILVKPCAQVGGAVTRVFGQSHEHEQSLPSSGQSQLHPHFNCFTSDDRGSTVEDPSAIYGVPSVMVVVSTVVIDSVFGSSVVFTSLVVVFGSLIVVAGQSAVPSRIVPFPFLILKLRRNLQPFSAFILNLFAVPTLFLGLQFIADSSLLRV